MRCSTHKLAAKLALAAVLVAVPAAGRATLHAPVIDPNFSNAIFAPFLLESTPTKAESMG